MIWLDAAVFVAQRMPWQSLSEHAGSAHMQHGGHVDAAVQAGCLGWQSPLTSLNCVNGRRFHCLAVGMVQVRWPIHEPPAHRPAVPSLVATAVAGGHLQVRGVASARPSARTCELTHVPL
jgi:hypothetical protein